MRLDDEPISSNFEDRTGQSFGGGGGPILGGGGGFLPLLLGLVASRFGIAGVGLLLLGYCALSSLGGGGTSTVGLPSAVQTGAPAGASRLDPQTRDFLVRVLGSTEQTWTQLFAQAGQRYQPTTLVAYSNYNQSGCGAAQAAMGPFYCPADQNIYIDPAFFEEMSTRFGAAGDFAQAYVIAHEVGHHIQTLTGVSEQVREAQQTAGRAEANALQVRMELQADCYAGVWAARNREVLEAGDVQEGLRAAQAIGDDTLQRSAGRVPVPESFTHGTSAQRARWLQIGLQSGDPNACNTFEAGRAAV